ncbi:androgen-dependent TFPI-regulating protein-like isoform X2 [Zerene cesonia]|uniref:androgen-dependent TFPI-regulating protein-like isoform X2 n=1 Tax=Zerene cesonia TaxID=33412 RepID=UPI0018E53141|nr:androgen-dependent TFPI-regulating protein-like isoform X2 [Zerene cesonia]
MGALPQPHIRLAGNIGFLLVHVINTIIMHFAVQKTLQSEDQQLKTFASFEYKYITIWNLAFQLFFLGLSIVCDLSVILKIDKKHKIINQIKRYKEFFFASTLWPTTLLIFTIFWPIFIYNRELIFPAFIDKVLTTVSNHIMHSFIILIVLWELVLQPRKQPKNHTWNLMNMTFIYVLYFIVIFHHYYMAGVWPYPMVNYMYGTIYFPIFMAFIAACLLPCCLALPIIPYPLLIIESNKHMENSRKPMDTRFYYICVTRSGVILKKDNNKYEKLSDSLE